MILMHNLPLKLMESTTSLQSLPCSCLLNNCCQQGTVALVSADGHCSCTGSLWNTPHTAYTTPWLGMSPHCGPTLCSSGAYSL